SITSTTCPIRRVPDMLKWEKLLNGKRIRVLSEAVESHKSKDDLRSEFQRDYDRSLFSTPVRRLQDKAQVFPLEPHDSVRTRLTHSMEVSSVARGLASGTARILREKKKLDDSLFPHHIETIAAACGLLHDIGNPPFGHAG